VHPLNRPTRIRYVLTFLLCAFLCAPLFGQHSAEEGNQAGNIPMISGGAGYIHNVSGGVSSLEPQINPVLLVPFGRHFLLESRTDFTGFFQRQNQTSGPFTGKVFKSVEFVQLDWLANTHANVVAGKYLLPFGLYNERLQPIWIKNLQDSPFTATIGTRTSGAGDGLMLRGVAKQTPATSIQYSGYFSAHSGINQLQSARTAGFDASLFLSKPRLEVGTSWQRFLEGRRINSSAAYVSWQPPATSLDLKSEFDYSYFGRGYWLEGAYKLDQLQVPQVLQKLQLVGRIEQVFPLHGGGNGLPSTQTKRFDVGLNYYLRDNLRFISSYARSFSSQRNANIWNVGFTYRFTVPLWFGEKK
jgi:hypothetical protein